MTKKIKRKRRTESSRILGKERKGEKERKKLQGGMTSREIDRGDRV